MLDRRIVVGGLLAMALVVAQQHVGGRERGTPSFAPAFSAPHPPASSTAAATASFDNQPPTLGDGPADALTTYFAMRDDANPKPRLRVLDDWTRAVRPGDNVDLIGQALVDPDESVRERAQALLDGQSIAR